MSNGPEVSRQPTGDGRVRIRFADTMKMSTYLAAWVVGPLELSPPADAPACRRTVHVPGKSDLTDFAAEVSVHSLNWFADYYGIPYPEAKVDNVAIPDFAQGAMENVGCITYRAGPADRSRALDPGGAARRRRDRRARARPHVVRRPRDDALVERDLAERGVRDVHVDARGRRVPSAWEIWNTFTRDRTNALEIDALETTRPIEYEVRSPDDASGMFDTLTYVKGGAVLRMLEQWLGAERFRDGIRRYLAKHAYGNTETHDLWDALEEETGEPVRRTMDAWIFQAGYPAISVARDGDRVRFTQHRYLPSNPDDDTTWPVPLMVRQVAGGDERLDRILIEADGAEPVLAPDAVASRTPARRASSASGTTTSSGRGSWKRDGGAVADRALQPGRRRWAASSRARRRRLVPRSRRRLRRETDLRVWQAILGGLGGSTGSSTTSRASACGRSCGPRAAGARAARLGPRGGRDRPHARALRGQLVQSLAILGADPETMAQCASSSSATTATRSSSRPRSKPSPPRSTKEDLDRLLGALPLAADAAGGGAVPVRHVEVPGEAEIERVLAASIRRGPHAGRAVPPRRSPRTATTGRGWRFIGALGPDAGPVRVVQHHRAGLGSGTSPTRPSSRRSMRSSGTTTSRRTT